MKQFNLQVCYALKFCKRQYANVLLLHTYKINVIQGYSLMFTPRTEFNNTRTIYGISYRWFIFIITILYNSWLLYKIYVI